MIAPHVKIIEQPASDRSRFRYQSEGVSILVGVSSTSSNRTYPTIQIFGHSGKAVAIMSCVTKDAPYRPHPFNIDGKLGCKKGVCTIKTAEGSSKVEFRNVGIKCVKKKDVLESLRERQQIQVDPFRTGFDMNPSSYDFGSVRLCFQVFTKAQDGKYTIPLAPVVSDPIYDRKNIPDLVINKISICVSRVDEEPDIIILCGRISGDNIQVRFYEELKGDLVWEAFGAFNPSQVHRQVAISFKAPKYYNLEIQTPVKVLVQLRRPSDQACSEPIPFEYTPSQEIGRKRKKPKIDGLLDLARCFENSDPIQVITTSEMKDNSISELLEQVRYLLGFPAIFLDSMNELLTYVPFWKADETGYNPLMNIRKEIVATRRIPTSTPSTGISTNIEPNAYMPFANDAAYPMNIPEPIQPELSNNNFQNFIHGDYNMNVPNEECHHHSQITYPNENTFDVGEFSLSQYDSMNFADLPQTQNPDSTMTDSFTRLARDAFDSIYQDNFI